MLRDSLSQSASDTNDTLPNGQIKFTFNKTIINLYETTGKVTIQGTVDEKIKNKVIDKINAINTISEPICTSNS